MNPRGHRIVLLKLWPTHTIGVSLSKSLTPYAAGNTGDTPALSQLCLDRNAVLFNVISGGLRRLNPFRCIIALLIGVAIATSPVGAAWASMKATSSPVQAVAVVVDTNTTASGAMNDCEKMMRATHQSVMTDLVTGADMGDCRCCNDKSACPSENCVYKCVKTFSDVGPAEVGVVFTAVRCQSAKPDRPPDWIDGPHPPPPRA